MNGKFSAAQLTALSHPLADNEGAPDEAYTWRTSNEGASGILPCDLDERDPEELRWSGLAGLGLPAGSCVCRVAARRGWRGCAVRFDEPGVCPDVFHLCRRMTLEEIETAFGLRVMSEETTQRGGVV